MSASPQVLWSELLRQAMTAQEEVFGEVAIEYQPAVGAAFSLPAIPLDATMLAALAPGSHMAVRAHASNFGEVTPAAGDRVQIGTAAYTIWDVNVRLAGIVFLGLKKVAL